MELISPDNCNPTGKNYNSSRSNKASNKPIGIEDPAVQVGILLYPNPASGSLTVLDMQGEYSGATLLVVDMLGRILLSGQIGEGSNTHSVDISTIQAGAYILILKKNGQIRRERFVKE
ncbi:MAG TPA: hypothetical protein DIW47_03380 [Bacteroidetes bacterium]|nr:hypothetical protein [Bacteroidota bacterium]